MFSIGGICIGVEGTSKKKCLYRNIVESGLFYDKTIGNDKIFVPSHNIYYLTKAFAAVSRLQIKT